MRLSSVRSVVERRLLINYRMAPDHAARVLPAPFEPQLVNGYAVAGICMIRLGGIRPRGVPARFGIRNENAAHRFAVQWRDGSGLRTGVYVPERHTSSRVNAALGGKLFPGLHEWARFEVSETATGVSIDFRDRHARCHVSAAAEIGGELEGSRLFASAAEASDFLRLSPQGFSPEVGTSRLEGVELRSLDWTVHPARIRHVRSSVFDDKARFPEGSIELDSALVMREIPVEWQVIPSVRDVETVDRLATTGAHLSR